MNLNFNLWQTSLAAIALNRRTRIASGARLLHLAVTAPALLLAPSLPAEALSAETALRVEGTRFKDPVCGALIGKGSGGSPFHHIRVDRAHVLVGLKVRSGAFIDAISPIWRERKLDGSLGELQTGARVGGPGGRATELLAPDGWVVAGIQCRTGSFVDALRLFYKPIGAETLPSGRYRKGRSEADMKTSPWKGGEGGGLRSPVFANGTGSVIGVRGYAARFVDNLAILSSKSNTLVAGSMKVARGRTGLPVDGLALTVSNGLKRIKSALGTDEPFHYVEDTFKVSTTYDDHGWDTRRKTFSATYTAPRGYVIDRIEGEAVKWDVNHLQHYESPQQTELQKAVVRYR